MKKNHIIMIALLLTPSLITPKAKSTPNKADSANTISIDLPSVKIHNNGTKKATITGITIDYKMTNEKSKKKVTTAAKIPIPTKKGKTFNLKLKLPISAADKGASAVPLGISKIKVESNDLEISPPWTGLSESTTTIAGSEKIFIHQTGSSWELDKEAMMKSAKNKGKHKTKHHKHAKNAKGKDAKDHADGKEHTHDHNKNHTSHAKGKDTKEKNSTNSMMAAIEAKGKHSSSKKTHKKKKSKDKDPMEHAMTSMKKAHKSKKSKPMSMMAAMHASSKKKGKTHPHSMMDALNKKHAKHTSAKSPGGKKDGMLAAMEKAAGKK